MKKLLSFILVLISSVTFLHSQETDVITFADKFSEASARGSVFSEIVPKENRVKSSATTIYRTFSEGMPDSISMCIDVAADIWESRLQCQTPIRLDFDYGDMFDSNNDTEIDVAYTKVNQDVVYPTSLYRYLINHNDENSTDAIIHINKNTKWDCGYSSVTNDKKNLTYAMLRAIAISLGFGSSVTKKKISGAEIITFTQQSGHSAFDNLIFSDSGKFLKDIPNLNKASNKELVDFVQSENGNLYACDKISTNKLYAPRTFETYKSLVYLDNPQSLMHYDISIGDKRLNIDDTTINLLREIGWNIQDKKDVEIKCDENNGSGILSAYSHHRFYINREDITSPKWKLVLPLKNGSDYIVCQSDNSLEFTSPAIDSISNYKLNINGDIYGRIIFEGCINDTKVTDTYRVSFEAKPHIASVKIKGKSLNIATNSYDLIYTVEYYGCSYLDIAVEEDGDAALRSSFSTEPFLAHIITKNITKNKYNWIDITAINKYGEDVYTIELEPIKGKYDGVDIDDIKTIDIGKTFNDNAYEDGYIERIAIYNNMGSFIKFISSISDLDNLESGLYILKFHNGSECVKTTKYIKR